MYNRSRVDSIEKYSYIVRISYVSRAIICYIGCMLALMVIHYETLNCVLTQND